MSNVAAFPDRAPRVGKLKTKVPSRATAPRKESARHKAARRRALYAGLGYAAICLGGMALSLTHQAAGVTNSTTATGWESWAMAIEIDAGFIAAKLTPYICGEGQRGEVERYAKPLAIAALILCAWFNLSGFMGYAPEGPIRAVICVILGCAVPGIIYALSQMAAVLLLGKAK